jgi:sortase A
MSPGSCSAFEAVCYTLGVLLLTFALAALTQSELRAATSRDRLPDMQLWSDSARARYVEAVAAEPAAILATLHIPRIQLEVPVYASASDLNLDRGAGIIDGMAYPHELGHIGIAGHRDGYFRAIKNLKLGDQIRLETINGTKVFEVRDLRVVEASELSYLAETDEQRLTIVTCYPFYFAGSAPQRYLARAVPITDDLTP